MSGSCVIHNVLPRGNDVVDVVVRDGRIAAIGPGAGANAHDLERYDGGGRLLFPGFIDAHTHMDKTLLGLAWHRHEIGPGLLDKIEHERAVRRDEQIDAHTQSMRHGRAAIATGTTHIRTHVDIDTEIGLSGLAGVQRTQEALRDVLDIQIVAFPQSGMLVRPGTVALLEDALRQGADVMGGLDPATIDRDPVRHLDTVFELAERYGVDLDIHLHEPGNLGAFSIELIAERTKALGYQGRVVISHAIALGSVDDAYRDRLIDLILEQDIAIMSHAPSGLHPIPSIAYLRSKGVRMCAGNDGIQDAWGPLNRPDMLERAYLMAYRNNLRRDDAIEDLLDIVTHGGADVMGIQGHGLAVGGAADLVVVDGETHVEAVARRPARHLVLRAGQVVARDGECLV